MSRDRAGPAVFVALFAVLAIAPMAAGRDSGSAEPLAGPVRYSTFLGGLGDDGAAGMAVDPTGNVFLAGNSRSVDFPTTPGAFNRSVGLPNAGNGWVAKFDRFGNLAWSTFFGGENTGDSVNDVAVDASGRVCIVGIARAPNFPTTPGAYDRTFHWGNGDAFVACLDGAGAGLSFSTILGGSGFDYASSIAIDSTGSIWVAGITSSADFPTSADGFDRSQNGMSDHFVARVSADGSRLEYGTFLGGSRNDWGWPLYVDLAGAPYIAGYTESPDLPTTPGAFDRSLDGGIDGFVARFKPGGRGLEYLTYLGGGSTDWVRGLDVDAAGNAYLTGRAAPGFPTTPDAFDGQYSRGDTFLAELNPTGTGLVFSTFFGGDLELTEGSGVLSVGPLGIWVAGATASSDFPTTPGAFDRTFNGGWFDAFLTLLSPDGRFLWYSTLFGGEDNDLAYSLDLGPRRELFISGSTGSLAFPASPNAWDDSHNGQSDAFLMGFALVGLPEVALGSPDSLVPGLAGLSGRARFSVEAVIGANETGGDPAVGAPLPGSAGPSTNPNARSGADVRR